MSETTEISWTDHTWSPWEGCTKVGPGCDHCYAAARNGRFAAGSNWGPGAPRRKTADASWRKPLQWAKQAKIDGMRPKVFPSLCDPFDNEVDPAWRHEFFDMIVATPELTWLLLTKRIGNAAAMIPAWLHGQMPGNVWLGATVVNQEEVDRDVQKLLETSAGVRFLSIEPMLGDVDITPFLPALDWVIAGGESGPRARPLHVDWLYKIVAQCKSAGVPVHVKQLGKRVHDSGCASPNQRWPSAIRRPIRRHAESDPPFEVELDHRKGGDLAEWPEALRVQEFPKTPSLEHCKGPKMAAIDTGDHIHHGPSGEDWLVAYVEGDSLACCGWPLSIAKISDCSLIKKATSEERLELLRQMADSVDDSRGIHARAILAREANDLPPPVDEANS